MSFISKGFLLSASLVILANSALASTDTASFSSGYQSGPTNGIEEYKFGTSDSDIDVWVSGWSDSDASSDDGPGDNTLRDENIVRYGSGWGIINADESDNQPNHSADNIKSNDGSDDGTWRDYDFFLLDFDEKVTLESASFGWVNGAASNNQVTFIALNDGTNADNTQHDLNGVQIGQLQSMVMGGVGSGSGYSQVMGNNGSYYADVGFEKSSSLWIVGAFNSAFGGNSNLAGNDGFKLSGISFSTSTPGGNTDIPEPAPLALMLIALCCLVRQKSIKK
mgnify:CR=1 FL=1